MPAIWFGIVHKQHGFFVRTRDLSGSKGLPKPLFNAVLSWPDAEAAQMAIPQVDEMSEFDKSELEVRPLEQVEIKHA
jgi:hypothetical protein